MSPSCEHARNVKAKHTETHSKSNHIKYLQNPAAIGLAYALRGDPLVWWAPPPPAPALTKLVMGSLGMTKGKTAWHSVHSICIQRKDKHQNTIHRAYDLNVLGPIALIKYRKMTKYSVRTLNRIIVLIPNQLTSVRGNSHFHWQQTLIQNPVITPKRKLIRWRIGGAPNGYRLWESERKEVDHGEWTEEELSDDAAADNMESYTLMLIMAPIFAEKSKQCSFWMIRINKTSSYCSSTSKILNVVSF